jgi:RNA polymerase sigma-70 factor (ECF subfamily)
LLTLKCYHRARPGAWPELPYYLRDGSRARSSYLSEPRATIHRRFQIVLQAERDKGLSSAELKGGTADLTLVSAIRSGDENAMAELYDRYSSVVYSIALRVLGETGAAEDVLQEVFLQLWRNPGLFDSSRGNMGPWLAVISRNRAIDALRKRRPETDIEDIVVSVVPDMAGEADRSRAMEKVRGALSAMPAQQRSALEMAYFEGLSHTEIAEKTGEPLGTIKTRIRTGLLSLRKVFIT